MSEDELRAYALADNRIALGSTWDNELLGVELSYLVSIDFDLSLTGFSTTEIDLTLANAAKDKEVVDALPPLGDVAVTRPGDIWTLGKHRLICGDAQDTMVVEQLLDGEPADMLMTDPPYNVPIQGHVSGTGRHREFAFASGEMSREDFTVFLAVTLASASIRLRDGAIAYCFMDWRHMYEIQQAGELVLGELKQLVVWNKSNAGMGSFYRSKHELIFVFKIGDAPHVNNFGLGEKGRYRTNVWEYPGMWSASKSRDAELALHPTPKPVQLVQLVQAAILDCSNRGDLILDIFAGSGSTLIVAERAGRKARLVEIDPIYCDRIIRRFEAETGMSATLGIDGPDFAAVSDERTCALETA